MTNFISEKEIIAGFKITFQKNKSVGEIKLLTERYWAMKELEEEYERLNRMSYMCDHDEYMALSKRLETLAEKRAKAQNEFYNLEDSGVFEKYFASRTKPVTEKTRAIEEARLAHVNKLREIMNLFKENGIILDTNDDEVHKGFFMCNGKKVFLCQCDGEYENIAKLVLQKIIALKESFASHRTTHLDQYKEFFMTFDLDKVVKEFERLNKEDENLYSGYVKLYTESEIEG